MSDTPAPEPSVVEETDGPISTTDYPIEPAAPEAGWAGGRAGWPARYTSVGSPRRLRDGRHRRRRRRTIRRRNAPRPLVLGPYGASSRPGSLQSARSAGSSRPRPART